MFFFSITGTSSTPWYSKGEKDEIDFLRRHKSYLSEIQKYSASEWPRRDVSKDFDEERDKELCISRNIMQIGGFSICDECRTILLGLRFRCLECKDIDLCMNCYEQKAEPYGHSSSHNMAPLKYGFFRNAFRTK